ncbi:MAG: hypothetical protein JXA44_04580 [Methanospirillaceae archaeon]|nr:hypothetical protein [Methanospirillaceae archaeon]
MKKIKTTLLILLVTLILTGMATAKEMQSISDPQEDVWSGTWTSDDFTFYIIQNGTEITGTYDPYDIDTYDPGMITGTLSADMKICTGKWVESGPNTLYLSDDAMSHWDTGGVYPEGMDQDYSYEMIWERRGRQTDPDNPWTGTWVNDEEREIMVQNGTVVRSTYYPLPPDEDEPGTFEGTVSEDNRTITGFWTETGNFTCILSGDNSSFHGAYMVDLAKSGKSYLWNAKRES